MHQTGVHGPGCLPADDDTLVSKSFPHGERMRHLAGWIPTKETDTIRPPVDGIGQILSTQGSNRPLPITGWIRFSEMPVLAEKTIKGAAGVKDS
jgi:hypothetical protein